MLIPVMRFYHTSLPHASTVSRKNTNRKLPFRPFLCYDREEFIEKGVEDPE